MCYAKACAATSLLLVELALGVGALPTAEKVRTSANSRLQVTYLSDNVALPDSVEPMPDLSILCECCIAVDQWLRF